MDSVTAVDRREGGDGAGVELAGAELVLLADAPGDRLDVGGGLPLSVPVALPEGDGSGIHGAMMPRSAASRSALAGAAQLELKMP